MKTENLAQLIQDKLKTEFDHEFLSDKENVVVEINDNTIEIIDMIDSTDTCGDEYDEYDEEDNVTLSQYKDQQQADQDQFIQDLKNFVYDILTKEGLDEFEYRIEL